MQPFTKVLRPATIENHLVYVSVRWDGKRLSISGVEGPRTNGDAWGSCGQISYQETYVPSPPWTSEGVKRLWELWDRWHLNDMRAGCEHQRAAWDTHKSLEVTSYKLTSEAFRLRDKALARAARSAALGEPIDWNESERALIERALILCDDWYKDQPNRAGVLAACFEVSKVEHKSAGWVTPREHPEGLLTRPCEVCGYAYDSKWLLEEVPEEVLAELLAMPESPTKPAWV